MKIIARFEKMKDGRISAEISVEQGENQKTTAYLLPNEEGTKDECCSISDSFETAEQAESFSVKWISLIQARILSIKDARIPDNKEITVQAY